jgi:hypothetical protein
MIKFKYDGLNEWAKCRDDIVYFAETYIKIYHPINGVQTIVLNETQLNIIDKHKKCKVFSELCERQVGKTTIASIIILHDSIFKDYNTTAIMSTNQSYSNEKIRLIHSMWELLPVFLKPLLTKKTKSEIVFENGSEMIAAGNVDRLRGRSIQNFYIDESEWVKNLSYIISFINPMIAANERGTLFALSSTRTTELIKEMTRN